MILLRKIGQFLWERFVSRFSRFMNFVSRYGGALPQFVNFTAPEKSRTVRIHKVGKTNEKKKKNEKKMKIRKFRTKSSSIRTARKYKSTISRAFKIISPKLTIDASKYDTYRKRGTIKTTRVRRERRRMARYREGGHLRTGKAEEPEIKARRENRDQAFRKIAAQQQHQKKPPAACSQKFEPSGSPKEPSREMPAGRVVARRSVRRRRSQRSLSGLGAASTARGGEGAAEAAEGDPLRAGEKARARYEPNGSPPGGANSSITLEISASLSDAGIDFMYVCARYASFSLHLSVRHGSIYLLN